MRILSTELYRGFRNKLFLLSICLSGILIAWYSIEQLPTMVYINESFALRGVEDDYLMTSFTAWFGTRNTYLQQNIYYFIFPFLAVLPFGTSFYTDKTSGYIKSICIRTKKTRYLLSKYVAVFLSGGISAIFPLILSFIISSSVLPSLNPEPSYVLSNIIYSDKWSGFFYLQPFIYMMIYITIIFLFSGLLACMALMISCFSTKMFLPLIFPFFVYLIESLFFELIGLENYSIMRIIQTGEFGTLISITILLLLCFAVSFIPYYCVGKREDVL